MNIRRSLTLLTRFALCGFMAASVSQSFAEFKVSVDKPDFDDLQSPEVGGNTNKKNFSPKDWLEVEVKFRVESSDPKVRFADRVEIRWYVAVKNPEGRGSWLLQKDVTHINVPVGEDVYGSVYLSPSGIMRLSGSDRASKNIVQFVGGEVKVDGDPAIFVNKGSESKPFWESTSDNLARSNKVPLLDKNETPFKFLWWDRYAETQAR